ncbi:MAG TPA: sugar phosphate nucleotidyltransferase [Thermoanaerobaculia bacterium]|jgi:NDP-sugar pyrophosphorylase family protein|nr:sugar phosphate nucleotidyltransferase [Thermoanaerobaculia bacterium]
MKAMILAAGYGTRLRPITYLLPKPVIPVCNKPLIAYAVENLLHAGVDEIIVNLHHLPDAIESFLVDTYEDVTFHFSLEHQILGTGGGVRHVRHLLEGDDEFLLVNGDTLQSPDLEALVRARRESDAIAALSLRHAPPNDKFTAVWLDHTPDGGRITGFGNGHGEPLMFGGAHAISTRIFDAMPDRDEFSIVDDVYAPILGSDTVAGIVDDNARWFDIGTPQRYLGASRALCGDSVIGDRSVVDGVLHGSVVWDACRIAAGVELTNCIVAHDVSISRPMQLRNTIVCRDETSIPPDSAYRREEGLVFASF